AIHVGVALAQVLDQANGVDHGGVIAAAELASDFRIAARGENLGQIHRHLPRAYNRAGAALARHFSSVDSVELANRALDLVDRDSAAVGRQDVGQLLFSQL